MLLKPNSLKFVLLLIGWIAVQSTAVVHEFSAEHIFSGNGHLCLAQTAHLDDLIESSAVVEFSGYQAPTDVVLNFFCEPVKATLVTLYPARAPPHYA